MIALATVEQTWFAYPMMTKKLSPSTPAVKLTATKTLNFLSAATKIPPMAGAGWVAFQPASLGAR
jgi:hypothetical protein